MRRLAVGLALVAGVLGGVVLINPPRRAFRVTSRILDPNPRASMFGPSFHDAAEQVGALGGPVSDRRLQIPLRRHRMIRSPAIAALLLSLAATPALAQEPPDPSGERADDRAAVERTIRASIGWALTKDLALLERVMAHDAELFIFNPDSTSVVGWDAFVRNFDFWMDPRFKATRFDVRDLRVTFSRSGDVAWWSAILDDLAEWDGRPVGWTDTRWTGVLERRDAAWVITQMHFSFAAGG